MKFNNKIKDILTRYRKTAQKLIEANDQLVEIEKELELSTFTPLEQWLLIGFALGETPYDQLERNLATLATIESEMLAADALESEALAAEANKPAKKPAKAKKKVARKMIKKAPLSNSIQYLGNT